MREKTFLLKKVEELSNETIKLAKELIKFPTVNPPGERYEECARFIRNKLEKIGFDAEIINVPVEKLPELVPCGERLPRPNILGTLKGIKGKPTLHFNGHYDVVPPGRGWTVTKPFEPVIREGKLYGRGSADMKAGIAAIIMAAKAVIEIGIPLKGTLTISVTPDEETGGQAGLGFLVRTGYLKRIDYALIPEPLVEVDGFHAAHKGALWLEIKVKGKAAHASMEFAGLNAFLKAAKLVLTLRNRLNEAFIRKGPSKYLIQPEKAGYPTILIGGIARGGVKINVVPDEFVFTIDRRINPEETSEEAYNEIIAIIEKMKSEDPELKVSVKKILEASPALTPIDHPFCKTLSNVFREVMGSSAKISLAPYFADMRYLTQIGIPSVMCGPGMLKQAHSANEYCYVKNIMTFTKIFALLIIKLLA